jgi:predicted HicB family RNase H-like nuclease
MSRPARPPRSGNESRINVSVDKELHRKLKSALALKDKTIRQWVIEQAQAAVAGLDTAEEPGGKR